jgi:hypothetical protein
MFELEDVIICKCILTKLETNFVLCKKFVVGLINNSNTLKFSLKKGRMKQYEYKEDKRIVRFDQNFFTFLFIHHHDQLETHPTTNMFSHNLLSLDG